jgi:RNA polymerase sigma-32 factor
MSPSQYLEDKRSDPATLVEDNQLQEMNLAGLSEAIKTLDDRSKDIIQRRFLSEDKVTLHDLAAEYSISAERVRQIENGALKKLKAFMSDAA